MKLYDKNGILDFLRNKMYEDYKDPVSPVLDPELKALVDSSISEATGEIVFLLPKLYPTLVKERNKDRIVFTLGMRTVDGYISDSCETVYVEEELGLTDIDDYEAQTSEGASAFYIESPQGLKKIENEISTIFGEAFTSPDLVEYSKVSTKDCVKAIQEKYQSTDKYKRTAKFKFGHMVIREFNETYTVIEYKNKLVYIIDMPLETEYYG